METLRTNVIGTLNVAEACHTKGVHMTLYATGCIFEYDEAHPIGGPGFTEEDKPNFDGRCAAGGGGRGLVGWAWSVYLERAHRSWTSLIFISFPSPHPTTHAMT